MADDSDEETVSMDDLFSVFMLGKWCTDETEPVRVL